MKIATKFLATLAYTLPEKLLTFMQIVIHLPDRAILTKP